MVTANIATEFVDLLGAAAAEIANLDSPANSIGCRLREVQQQFRPLRRTIGELAQLVDVAPRDVLDAVMASGICVFWHQGQHLRNRAQLEDYLAMAFHIDPVPELEFELTAEQADQLSTEMDVSLDGPKTLESHANATEDGFEQLLMDAAVEIAMLDGTDNDVFRRLISELQNQSKSQASGEHESMAARLHVAKPPRRFSPSDSEAPARKASQKKHSG